LKERIQQESKAETPCSLFVGMVGAAMDTYEINVPECFNIVNELSRSPPQPKPEQLDDKCLADLRGVASISKKNLKKKKLLMAG